MDDLLEVDLPADIPSLRVARLVLWEAAARVGLDCDAADDLCLALDEVCYVVFDRVIDGDRLVLRIRTTGGVRVEGRVRTRARAEALDFGALAHALVALAVDDYTLDVHPDGVHFTMTKAAPVLELR